MVSREGVESMFASFKKGVVTAHSYVDETGPRERGVLKTGGRFERRVGAKGLGCTVPGGGPGAGTCRASRAAAGVVQSWADRTSAGAEERLLS